jgi:hypothetical protein
MVHWFSPRHLLRVGAEIVASRLVTRVLDPRVLEQGSSQDQTDNGFHRPFKGHSVTGSGRSLSESLGHYEWYSHREFWIDYAADVGDGWNPTFTVARTLARRSLELTDPAGEKHETQRGRVLVLGGDLAYPTPQGNNYEERLLMPYQTALEKTEPPHPVVLAIPGRRDWYDGLQAFARTFLPPTKAFAGWVTGQNVSYFAEQVTGHWWLLGTDLRIGAQLDPLQFDFFQEVGKQMSATSRVILCMPEPDWLAHTMRDPDATPRPSDQVEDVLRDAIGNKSWRIAVLLAGARHHYQRYAMLDGTPNEPVRIVCGGGGAFLTPTHMPLRRKLRSHLEIKSSYPAPEDSERYLKRLLAFPIQNLSFGLIPGLLYTLVAWGALWQSEPLGGFVAFARSFAHEIATSVPSLVVFLATGGAILAFQERRSKLSGLLALVHTAAQIAAIVVISFAVTLWASSHFPELSGRRALLELGLVFVGGWIVGPALLGLYLWGSVQCNRFGEIAYSALRIQDWKSFLRLRFGADGTLTIFPIGFERVARRWARRTSEEGESELDPEDAWATPPKLIEMPIVVRGRTTE